MIFGPTHGTPMENGSFRAHLSAPGYGVAELRAAFDECIREGEAGNLGVVELEAGLVAATVLLASHDIDVPGADIVTATLSADRLAAIRAGVPIDQAMQALDWIEAALSRGLLDDLGTEASVAEDFRRNVTWLKVRMSDLQVMA